jgi:hypothetical protein
MSFCYRGDPRALLRAGDGRTNGIARVVGPHNRELSIIFSDGLGWEHVSVSTPARWPEMCFVKALFWSPDDVVIQFHPAEAEYVNQHPNCLHLWRPQGVTLPTPPPILVGARTVDELRKVLDDAGSVL